MGYLGAANLAELKANARYIVLVLPAKESAPHDVIKSRAPTSHLSPLKEFSMLTPFTSKIITDTGISMGDEGKGRLIPELIQELEELTGSTDPVGIVMKVNGGANSGHTAGGLKLNLLPAGIIAEKVPYLTIGAGVVADPRKFNKEALPLESKGYDILGRLRIDERTMLGDLNHRLLDLAWGTTAVKYSRKSHAVRPVAELALLTPMKSLSGRSFMKI